MLNMITLSQSHAVLMLGEGVFELRNLLPVCGVMLLVAWAMMRLRSKKRNSRPLATPQEIIERNRQARGMQGQLEELMVEVEALTRRFGVQLDAKARRLETLITQAEDRIAELRELQGQPSMQSVYDDQQQVDQSQHAPLQTAASSGQVPPSPPSIQQLDDDPLAISVYNLADSGMDAHAIAMQLNEHVGKIELILALRKAR
jgi:hypothetical protein